MLRKSILVAALAFTAIGCGRESSQSEGSEVQGSFAAGAVVGKVQVCSGETIDFDVASFQRCQRAYRSLNQGNTALWGGFGLIGPVNEPVGRNEVQIAAKSSIPSMDYKGFCSHAEDNPNATIVLDGSESIVARELLSCPARFGLMKLEDMAEGAAADYSGIGGVSRSRR
jgi:hypothetical protein